MSEVGNCATSLSPFEAPVSLGVPASFYVSCQLCLAACFSSLFEFRFLFLGVPGVRLSTVTIEQWDSSDELSRSVSVVSCR